MPQLQVYDRGRQPDYIGEGLGKAASGFGQVLFQRQEEQMQRDAIQRIASKYKPGQTRAQFIQETSNIGGIPIEARLGAFDLFQKEELAQLEREKQKRIEDNEQLTRQALGGMFGLTPEQSKGLDLKEALKAASEQNIKKQELDLEREKLSQARLLAENKDIQESLKRDQELAIQEAIEQNKLALLQLGIEEKESEFTRKETSEIRSEERAEEREVRKEERKEKVDISAERRKDIDKLNSEEREDLRKINTEKRSEQFKIEGESRAKQLKIDQEVRDQIVKIDDEIRKRSYEESDFLRERRAKLVDRVLDEYEEIEKEKRQKILKNAEIHENRKTNVLGKNIELRNALELEEAKAKNASALEKQKSEDKSKAEQKKDEKQYAAKAKIGEKLYGLTPEESQGLDIKSAFRAVDQKQVKVAKSEEKEASQSAKEKAKKDALDEKAKAKRAAEVGKYEVLKPTLRSQGIQVPDELPEGVDTAAFVKAAELEASGDSAKIEKIKLWKPQLDQIDNSKKKANKLKETNINFERQIATGKVGPANWKNFFVKQFGLQGSPIGNLIEEPASQAARSLTYDYITGKKDDFGVHLTDRDLAVVVDKIASPDKTDAVNRAILGFMNYDIDRDIETSKLKDEILKENGGVPPLDFGTQLNERLDKFEKDRGKELGYAIQEILSADVRGRKVTTVFINPDTGEELDFEGPLTKENILELESLNFIRK